MAAPNKAPAKPAASTNQMQVGTAQTQSALISQFFDAFQADLESAAQTSKLEMHAFRASMLAEMQRNAAGEKTSMRFSFTNLNSKSYIPGVNFERKTVAASLTFQPISNLHISSNLNYIHSKSDNRPATKYGSENINYALVAWFGRSNNISPLKDYWQPGLENGQQYSYNYTFFDNPYFTLYENSNAFGKDRALGNITARYDLTDAFSIQVRSGMDLQDESRNFRRAFSTNRFKKGAYAEQKVFFRETSKSRKLSSASAGNRFNSSITS